MLNKNRGLRLAQTATVAAFTVLLAAPSAHTANAQSPATMAPPVSGTFDAGAGNGGTPAGDSVFQWQDVPQNREVPITRAVFDQGGYQLYDDTGETIVIPFANQNLYVMRFGQSSTGSMYFVNGGSTPTLYVPSGGYLENASAQGARWYPFPKTYAYSAPVYVGPAPSWSEYVSMGWYPGMQYYGGYYGYHPWRLGVSFSPLPGLYFSIFDHPYYGWNSYHSYYSYHPYNRVYFRDVPVRNHYYSVARRGPSYFNSHPTRFGGYGSHYNAFHGRPSGNFGGSSAASHSFGNNAARNNGSFGTSHSSGTSHSFGNSRTFGAGRDSGTSNRFGTTTTHLTTATHTFGSSSAGTSSPRTFRGGQGNSGRSDSGRTSSGSFGTSRPSGGSFGGSRQSNGTSGGSRPSTSGGSGGSFGGGRPSNGSFGGGGRPSGGGGFSAGRPSGGSLGGGSHSTGGGGGGHHR